MKTCRDCGTHTSAQSGLCHECTHHPVERALPPGRWVGGLVKRYMPYVPSTWVPAETLGVTCHCGCLLVSATETCPACFVWAERNAREHAIAQHREAHRVVVRDREVAENWQLVA